VWRECNLNKWRQLPACSFGEEPQQRGLAGFMARFVWFGLVWFGLVWFACLPACLPECPSKRGQPLHGCQQESAQVNWAQLVQLSRQQMEKF